MTKQKTDEQEKANKLAHEEQLRKEEEEKKKALEAQRIAEEDAAKRLAGQEEEKKKASEEVGAKPLKESKHWADILKDYTDEYKKEPENGVLIFPNQAAVTKFFGDQAKLGREFLCAEVTPEGKRTGHYEFSCGNGELYEGNLEEIKQQLEDALANNPSKENAEKIERGIKTIESVMKANPVQEARKALQDMKKKEEPTEAPDLTTPNPLSTTPKNQ